MSVYPDAGAGEHHSRSASARTRGSPTVSPSCASSARTLQHANREEEKRAKGKDAEEESGDHEVDQRSFASVAGLLPSRLADSKASQDMSLQPVIGDGEGEEREEKRRERQDSEERRRGEEQEKRRREEEEKRIAEELFGDIEREIEEEERPRAQRGGRAQREGRDKGRAGEITDTEGGGTPTRFSRSRRAATCSTSCWTAVASIHLSAAS